MIAPAAARRRVFTVDSAIQVIPWITVLCIFVALSWALAIHSWALGYANAVSTATYRAVKNAPASNVLEGIHEAIARMEGARKDLLDSSAITFLWTTVMFFVVGLSLYLYAKAHRDLRQDDANAQRIASGVASLDPLLRSIAESQAMAALYGQAQQLAALLATDPKNAVSERAPRLREALRVIDEHLDEACKLDLGLEPQVFKNAIFDAAVNTRSSLKQFSVVDAPTGEPLLDLSTKQLAVLERTPFVRRYDDLCREFRESVRIIQLPSSDID